VHTGALPEMTAVQKGGAVAVSNPKHCPPIFGWDSRCALAYSAMARALDGR
jgi:hypothetical protein